MNGEHMKQLAQVAFQQACSAYAEQKATYELIRGLSSELSKDSETIQHLKQVLKIKQRKAVIEANHAIDLASCVSESLADNFRQAFAWVKFFENK